VFCRHTRDHDKRNIAEKLLKKLCEISEVNCRELICDIQKNYHLSWKTRTVGEDDCCGSAGVRRPETGRFFIQILNHAKVLQGHLQYETASFLEKIKRNGGFDLSKAAVYE
jgi:hypothetical protein